MDTEIAIIENTEIVPINVVPQRNPALVYLAGLAESSRRPMRQSLNLIADLVTCSACDASNMPWWLLRYQHTHAIRSALAERCSASTANRHLSALRGVLKECWRLGYLTAEDFQRAIDLKTIKGQKASQAEKGRHLKHGELSALLQACDDGTKAGMRDGAIIALAYGCGLRRSELAELLVSDYEQRERKLTIRQGKGNKERMIPVADGAADALADWLIVRTEDQGALFTAIRKGDHLTLDGMTDQAVYYILAARAELAGVKAFSPHDLRRTFAGDLLDAGADISTVQKLMGHNSANTTAGYDRRDAHAKRKAVALLHIPYLRHFPD